MFWRDEDTRVMLRGRSDWINEDVFGRPSWSTTRPPRENRGPDPLRLGGEGLPVPHAGRVVPRRPGHSHRRHSRLRLRRPRETAPYLVSVVELDDESREEARTPEPGSPRDLPRMHDHRPMAGYAPIVHPISIFRRLQGYQHDRHPAQHGRHLPSDNRPPTLSQQIVRMEDQFAMAAPRGIEAKQLVRDALTALRQNPELAECDPQSVLGGLMTMAQLRLRVGVLGHGWLLPFRDWKTKRRRPSSSSATRPRELAWPPVTRSSPPRRVPSTRTTTSASSTASTRRWNTPRAR